jgi:hypothetical protein
MESHKAGFPPFPHSLEIPAGFPHSHGLDDELSIFKQDKTKPKPPQGAVTDVPGPKRNACPGTLIHQEGLVSASRGFARICFRGVAGCPRWDGESPRQGPTFLAVLAGSWGRELAFPVLIFQMVRALAG